MTGVHRVLVAPDKFKHSLAAAEVAAHLAAGLERGGVEAVACVPVADGGDGTVDAVLAAGWQRQPLVASGPTGAPVATAWARQGREDGRSSWRPGPPRRVATAGPSQAPGDERLDAYGPLPARRGLVELAAVCGLARLPGGRPDPIGATSFGLGQVIAAALDAGCDEVVIGIGGSASTDGGAGMVQALGGRLLGAGGAALSAGGAALSAGGAGLAAGGAALPAGGAALPAGGAALPAGGAALAAGGAALSAGGNAVDRVASLDLSGLHPALASAHLVVASDVDNPLYGPAGAASVYGPQKGAGPDDVALLDRRLRRWAEVVAAATGRDLADAPGAGAAGGVGFAALAILGATMRPGIDLVLDLVGFDAHLAGADLVVTGEGRLDEQTLHGKAVAGVAARARAAGVPALAVAGLVDLEPGDLAAAGLAGAYALSDLEPDPAVSMAEAGRLLEEVGARIAGDVLASSPSVWARGG